MPGCYCCPRPTMNTARIQPPPTQLHLQIETIKCTHPGTIAEIGSSRPVVNPERTTHNCTIKGLKILFASQCMNHSSLDHQINKTSVKLETCNHLALVIKGYRISHCNSQTGSLIDLVDLNYKLSCAYQSVGYLNKLGPSYREFHT